jgi:hypothetical protein
MPDQNISSSGSREAELQRLKSAGLRSSSLSDECREFSRLSTAFFSRTSCDVKASLRADGVAGVLLTKAQNHSLAKKQLLAAAAAVPVTCDSATKTSITSPKIPSQREPPLKTVGFGSSVAASAAVVKPLETKGEARLGRKRKAQSSPSSSETTIKPENVEIASSDSESPPEYRGVRVRPGVKGFLVEIRPKRWKKTIWLGTYQTSPEAARAYDAGIFYTGKCIPYNFQESEGSFPPLPKHLSLANFDPDVMEQSKVFVKQRAVEAAMRKVPSSRLPLTRNKVDNETSSVGVQGCNFTSGFACENKGVKGEEYVGFDPVTADPFQNLEPLPYDLSCCDKQLFGNDKDCWGRISVAVDDYMLQTAMVGDEDLDIEKQRLNPTDGVLFETLRDEEKVSLGKKNTYIH